MDQALQDADQFWAMNHDRFALVHAQSPDDEIPLYCYESDAVYELFKPGATKTWSAAHHKEVMEIIFYRMAGRGYLPRLITIEAQEYEEWRRRLGHEESPSTCASFHDYLLD